MSRVFSDYLRKATQILDGNWMGSSTKPAPALYPHQWSWDSAFIAIGRSHYDTKRAMEELETLFDAQWTNGMLPQIVFNPEALGHYFPEPDFWQTERSPHRPPGKLTSGITMPPVHAIAAERIHQNGGNTKTILAFLKRIYPKLYRFHEYLYRERDPHDEGLVFIRHPWESGIDNSPTWDQPLRAIPLDGISLPRYERKDLGHGVDPKMRPSDEDYDRYVYLVDLFRQADYDEAQIRDTCPFMVQDVLFNSVLCRANESLARIAALVDQSPEVPHDWTGRTSEAIRTKLWHSEHNVFDCYDLIAEKPIEVDTAAGFIPLFAGAADRNQARTLYERLDSASFCALQQGNCFTVPNYDTQKDEFDRSNYWRGPVWININWMIAQGLRRYGYTLKADSLQKDLLQLPLRFGFHEYFDSFDGTGYGSNHFSWTAALFIDLVYEFYENERTWDHMVAKVRSVMVPSRVLNDGDEMPQEPYADLGGRLMASIKNLRDTFYDTSRGRVDYAALGESEAYGRYRLLTNGLRRFDIGRLIGRREKLAFWINLYNSIVVDGIICLGIRHSVQEAPELFSRLRYTIGPHSFSADDIEHGILRGNVRPPFRPFRQFGPGDPRRDWVVSPVDPRIHFALVCGSRSCAPIDFYDTNRIYEQLEKATQSFMNSSEVIVLPEEKRVLLSEIFRWYEGDFGGRQGVLDFLYDHLADDTVREFIKKEGRQMTFEYIYYDWNLNR